MILVVVLAIAGALLYRLRGGWLRDLTGELRWWNGTHAMRATWALPTALCIYALAGGPWWLAPALAVSVFASMALIGHGAHMVFDSRIWLEQSKNKTELLTFWLPWVFGKPELTWAHDRATAFNLAGMSTIGVVRNAIAIAPIFAAGGQALEAAFYIITGAMHGPLYWAGWRAKGNSATGELFVGFWTWGLIAAFFN